MALKYPDTELYDPGIDGENESFSCPVDMLPGEAEIPPERPLPDDAELPSGVVHLRLERGDVYLIGTAHVSEKSVRQVSRVIEMVWPDTVCIELCERRYRQMRMPQAYHKAPLGWREIFRSRRPFYELAQWMLIMFYQKIGTRLKVDPGAEMLEAIHAADRIGADILPIDRDVDDTLEMCWSSLSFFQKIRLFFEGLWYLTGIPMPSASSVEAMKEPDKLNELINTFGDDYPDMKMRLIDERDLFMADRIRQAAGPRIVAVVGAGHGPGIAAHLSNPAGVH